jgi:hypothetical protein
VTNNTECFVSKSGDRYCKEEIILSPEERAHNFGVFLIVLPLIVIYALIIIKLSAIFDSGYLMIAGFILVPLAFGLFIIF